MKKKKYLPLYYKWMNSGRLTCRGLCGELGDELKMFEPTLEYSKQMYSWVENVSDWYWAYSGDNRTAGEYIEARALSFSPMRQNIVLFLAAMAGEFDKNYEKPRRKKK